MSAHSRGAGVENACTCAQRERKRSATKANQDAGARDRSSELECSLWSCASMFYAHEGWGTTIMLILPGECHVLLCQPRHPVATAL